MRSPDESTCRNLRYFGDHRCLSQWEESKCMWTHGKMASHECLWKVSPGGCETGSGEGWGIGVKIKWRLSEVNVRAMSRGQDELVGRIWSICTFQQESKRNWWDLLLSLVRSFPFHVVFYQYFHKSRSPLRFSRYLKSITRILMTFEKSL